MLIKIKVVFEMDNMLNLTPKEAFKAVKPEIFQELVSQAILSSGEEYKEKLSRVLGANLIWKSRHGNRRIHISDLTGKISLPLLQVQRKDTGEKIYLTRYILGLEPYRRIPRGCREIMAQLGASISCRAGARILNSLTGQKFSLSTIHQAVQDFP